MYVLGVPGSENSDERKLRPSETVRTRVLKEEMQQQLSQVVLQALIHAGKDRLSLFA